MSTPRHHTPGTLDAIWTKRMKNGPMDSHDRIRMIANHGLDGNADVGRRRQVTILSADAWSDVQAALGFDLPPTARRANLLVRGVALAASRGRVLQIGPCRIRIGGETRPCNRMDEACAGLRDLLDPDWRGGIYGVVLDDGEIAIGDPVRWIH